MNKISAISYKNLYELAVQMLEITNPYNCELCDLLYVVSEGNKRTEYSLVKLLKNIIGDCRKNGRHDENEEHDFSLCLKFISEALYRYYENYNSFSYAHKNLIKRQLFNWQETIIETFKIEKVDVVEELQPGRDDLDKGLAIIKLLHNQEGINVKEISEVLNVTERTVQKELKKLAGTDEKSKQYCIGGQPIKLKININDTVRPPIYKTINTVHPIVLQENVMQAANILQSLADSYIEKERVISLVTGIDIWAQLSDYAQMRIKVCFAIFDSNLTRFIEEIEAVVPNGSTLLKFSTERSMISEWGASDQENLQFFLKGKNRICDIKLKNSDYKLLRQTIEISFGKDGKIYIIASDKNGCITKINYEEIEYVE